MLSFPCGLIFVLALVLPACAPPLPGETDPAPVASAPMSPPPSEPARPLSGPVLGVDVSSHSGAVDWRQVRTAGHTFAFVKATEGVDLADPAFSENWRAMKAAGVVRGAYHFYVTEDDPDQQAEFFISNVSLEPGDLAPVVDVELLGHDTQPGLAGRLRRWLELVEAHYGIRPILYTSPNFWDQNLDDTFGIYPLWVAEYGVEAPRLPAGWQSWALWQYQADAEVPGVESGADLNRLGQDIDLSAFLLPLASGSSSE